MKHAAEIVVNDVANTNRKCGRWKWPTFSVGGRVRHLLLQMTSCDCVVRLAIRQRAIILRTTRKLGENGSGSLEKG